MVYSVFLWDVALTKKPEGPSVRPTKNLSQNWLMLGWLTM